jgi:CDP-diacylglycerol--glycerol-3-phosphate 3-phosphatidyltransferase
MRRVFHGHALANPSGGSSLVAVFDGKFRTPVDRAVRPVGAMLRRTGMSPDHLTLAGVVVAAGAAVAIGAGKLYLGFALVILAAIPDLLDGALAKASGQSSQRGAFFDSVIDRLTDAIVFAGVAYYYVDGDDPRLAMVPLGILAISLIISYERAKAESLGLEAKGGLMERAERIILLELGLLVHVILLPILWVMLVLTAFTATQRFVKVWKQAAVTPRTAAKLEIRRVRRASRRAAYAERHPTRVPRRRPKA